MLDSKIDLNVDNLLIKDQMKDLLLMKCMTKWNGHANVDGI